VSLEIAQEVSRVPAPTGRNSDLTPRITQRKITSRVNVQNSQTVVLGGLIQDSETRGRDRVPVLGDIPVVGNLFGSTNSAARRTELIVFITPRVIRNPEDARDVSEELRSRLRSLRPEQGPLGSPLATVPGPSRPPTYYGGPSQQPPQGPRSLIPRAGAPAGRRRQGRAGPRPSDGASAAAG
jgi:general secretion pathway protein D